MKGEHDVTDWALAAYFHYNGLPLLKCITSGKSATWTFGVEQFDTEVIEQEFANDEQAIFVNSYVNSIKVVQHFQKLSKEGMGVWTDSRYASRSEQ